MKTISPLPPTVICIIGITGDLAKRKLLPALEAIACAGAMPARFRILGTTRQKGATLEQVFGELDAPHLYAQTELLVLDTDDHAAYAELQKRLLDYDRLCTTPAQRLFYLSVPPSAVRSIIEHLGTSGLANVPNTKVLLEKPFGTDLTSATELVAHSEAWFTPEQMYRIDHYLAKQMARNILTFRETNALFQKTWNAQFIERIEILASERIGIEGRARFYEETGALRDVVQSHLLQLAALTLVPPASHGAETIPERRLAVLQSLSLRKGSGRRGQYRGYRDDVQNPMSAVETFVDLTLESAMPRLAGIPVRLIAGKMLSEKKTEIRVYYRTEQIGEANELILRLQPHEGIRVDMWAQKPGYEESVERHVLGFEYKDHYTALPEAYEKVLVDVMHGDHDFFVSSAEVIESWRILAPLQEAWQRSGDDLCTYEPGTDPF